MEIIYSIDEMRSQAQLARTNGKTLGLVPTMGCLHEGHLSLVRHSLDNCDFTIVSIFINPTQFGENEDLDNYPIELGKDRRKLETLDIDVLFLPSRIEMYSEDHKTYVSVDEITTRLCGKSRPFLYRGVTTIVLKLFNIVHPHFAFFGKKDRQQLHVIEAMVKDLNLDVCIMGLPIIRESDGLAMSSRNLYLSVEERSSALSLHKALIIAEDLIQNGETSAKKIKRTISDIINKEKHTKIDYISVCDTETFIDKELITNDVLIALAVHIGKARLIDNCIVEGN